MTPAPIKPLITFDEFEKLDSRVGTITAVSPIPKSNKLMKLTADFGDQMPCGAGDPDAQRQPRRIILGHNKAKCPHTK